MTELQEPLGYAPDDHFRGGTKMVSLGSSAEYSGEEEDLKRLEPRMKSDKKELSRQPGKLPELDEEKP